MMHCSRKSVCKVLSTAVLGRAGTDRNLVVPDCRGGRVDGTDRLGGGRYCGSWDDESAGDDDLFCEKDRKTGLAGECMAVQADSG